MLKRIRFIIFVLIIVVLINIILSLLPGIKMGRTPTHSGTGSPLLTNPEANGLLAPEEDTNY